MTNKSERNVGIAGDIFRQRAHALDRAIKEISLGTFRPAISDEDFDQFLRECPAQIPPPPHPIYGEASELWKKLKIERNAIIAKLTDLSWTNRRFNVQRDTYTPPASEPDLYISSQTHELFAEAVRRTLKSVQKQRHPLHYWGVRFSKMVSLANRFDPPEDSRTPASFIINGVGAADLVIFGLISVLVSLKHEKNIELTKKEAREVLDGATRGIGIILASQSIEANELILFNLSTSDQNGLDPSHFELVENDRKKRGVGWRFILKEIWMKEILDLAKASDSITWCPTRTRVDGHSPVIEQYFNWILDVAFKYDKRLSSLPDDSV